MSQFIFPTLQGLTWDISKTPVWKTTIQESTSGRETRLRNWSYPKYQISLNCEFLTTNNYNGSLVSGELETLMGFFNSVGGSFDDFLYLDPQDNEVSNQVFGIGDGILTQFQLVRHLPNWIEPIYGLITLPVITNNNKVVTNYTINNNALVTFATAPSRGTVLRWSGNFYFRVRFLDDTTEFNQFLYNLFECKSIKLITVKP